MFMVWKAWYYQDGSGAQSDLHIQCNLYEKLNGPFSFVEMGNTDSKIYVALPGIPGTSLKQK